jgi:antitoxin component of RelBE/YafQ-DinJ toxin-antitoxin module
MNKDKDYALPKAVSIKKELYDEAMKKADSLGLSFSQLVTVLLKKEMQSKGDFTIPKSKEKDGFSDW